MQQEPALQPERPCAKEKQAAHLFFQLSTDERIAWLRGEKTFRELFGYGPEMAVRRELIDLIFAWECDRDV